MRKRPHQPAVLQAATGTAERQAAITSFERGDYAGAARMLVPLLARTAPDALLSRLCGMSLLRCNAAAQGLPYLDQARRLAPQDPLSMLWHGIALHAAGQYDAAVEVLQASAAASPSDPGPLIHLSRALMQLGRLPDAAVAARRAARLAPSMPEAIHALGLAELVLVQASTPADPPALAQAWLGFGLACLRLDRVTEARHALEQALVAAPDHAETGAHLAMVEHLCGEPLAAIARLRAILAREPDCAIARLHLASRLILDNDAAEGLALLQAVPPPSPPLLAHWQAQTIDALLRLDRSDAADRVLAQVRPPVGDAEILLRQLHARLARTAGDGVTEARLMEQVEALAAQRDAATLGDRIEARFVLAARSEAAGQADRAFTHWQHGHALLRAAQPFSRDVHQALLDTVVARFDRARLQDGPRATRTDPAPVFIVGLPRTGTTLTEHILSAHGAVFGAGERLATRETLAACTGTTDALDAVGLAAGLDTAALDRAADGYLADLHALAPGAARVLDKMPDNILHLGFLATLLPGARVICCTRDLRDVGASIFRHRFLGHHPYAHDLGDLGWYMAQHERLLRHWQRSLTLPMLLVDHQEWIDGFEPTLERVLDFLGLPPDPACLRFHEQERRAATASRDQVSEPVNARGVGVWRRHAAQLAPMLRALEQERARS